MKWGHYQRKCHELLDEMFDNKNDAYKWLNQEFKVKHFADLKSPQDDELIRNIYHKLYVKSFESL